MDISKITVLLVEDDTNVRITIRAMLEEMGISYIHEVDNGSDALQYMKRLDYINDASLCQLVICDWNMPQKTGIEFLREIRVTHPKLPFLMITARADKESIIAAKESQVTSYIRKPVTFEDLQKKITTIFAQAN